jgi:phosphopantothenoylcysteine decarboxylase/phosphopantothenate--cysteine ligase
MGISIVKKAIQMGADVTLIYANISVDLPEKSKNIKTLTAMEMKNAVFEHFDSCDVLIMAGAVSDYCVKNISKSKIKKLSNNLTIELETNPDILLELSEINNQEKIIVGFAAETEDLERNAIDKLNRKKMDMIVANDVSIKDSGFESDQNKIKIFTKSGNKYDFPLMSKIEASEKVLERIIEIMKDYRR